MATIFHCIIQRCNQTSQNEEAEGSGSTRFFFLCVGDIEGEKCDSEGAKIQKFAKNG